MKTNLYESISKICGLIHYMKINKIYKFSFILEIKIEDNLF